MSDKTTLSDFVANHLFHKIETDDGVVHWREVVGMGDGYVVIFTDGSHFHTYHYPPGWITARDDAPKGIAVQCGPVTAVRSGNVVQWHGVTTGTPIPFIPAQCAHLRASESVGPTTDQINGYCRDCGAVWTRFPERIK